MENKNPLVQLITVPVGKVGTTREEEKAILSQIKRDPTRDKDEFIDQNYQWFYDDYFDGDKEDRKEDPDWQDVADHGDNLAFSVMLEIYKYYIEGDDIYLLTK